MSAAEANPNINDTNAIPTYDAILQIVRQLPVEQHYTLLKEVLQTLVPRWA